MSKRRTVILLVLVLLVGCIKKPSGQITPWEKVTTYNALLASTNKVVAQGVIASQLDVNTTGQTLALANTVAQIDEQLTNVLEKGSSMTRADTDQVSQLLQVVRESGVKLIQSGSIGIKNPQSQQTIATDVKTIVDIADLILQLIPQLVSNPAPPAVSGVAR